MSKSEPKETQRIAKLLARAGIASRREIERMIADGRVALDGRVLDTPATLLPSLAGVTVDGNPVAAATPARLFVFHKPAGVLTAERDFSGRPTIYDRLPPELPRLVPVGRLDLNTEGLLLMTTDGALKRQLELPATGVQRAYRARAYGTVTQAQLEELIEGVEVGGVRYGSIDANLERRTGANVWIEMILTEGKNREVRRVLEYLGLRVSRLIRTRYGPFVLGDLPAGAIGEVRRHDLVAFRQSLGKGGTIAPIAVGTEPRPDRGARPSPTPATARTGDGASDRTRREPSSRERAARPASPGQHGESAASPRPARRPAKADAPVRTQRAEAAAQPRSARRPTKADAPVRAQRAEVAAQPRSARATRSDAPARTQRGRPTGSDAAPDTPRTGPPKRKPGWARPKPKPTRGRR